MFSMSKIAMSALVAAGILSQAVLAGPLDLSPLGNHNTKRQFGDVSGPGCGPHEIAVGTYSVCSPQPGPHPVIPPDGNCGNEYGAIWEWGQCDVGAYSLSGMKSGFCDGGFKDDLEVRCNQKGEAHSMYSKGFLIPWLSQCRPHKVTCRRTIGIASATSKIEFCCGVGFDNAVQGP